MSKQPQFDDEELPPTYFEATEVATPLTASTLPSLFSTHLRNLPSQILSAQATRTSSRDQIDSEVLGLLVPHIDELLSSISAMDPPPQRVEMTLIPQNAVGYEWEFSDQHDTRTLVRVRKDTKGHGDEKKPQQVQVPSPLERSLDEWGRWRDEAESSAAQDSLWWSDGEMATRLAKYLQPKRVDRQTVRVQMNKVKEVKKSNRWSLFKKSETPPPPSPSTARVFEEEEDATMTVKAEEVTFRRTNKFGLYEGKTGWGIVVCVRVRR